MANATQILRLTCSHDYFSGAIEGLRLQPTKATERWADSHRVLIRDLSTDITLYITDETPEDYREPVRFLLLVNDMQFYNYTLLPDIATKDKLCYLTNRNDKLSAWSEIDETDFFDKVYGIALGEGSAGEEKQLSVKNRAGEVMVDISWDGRSSLSPFISDLPPGKYDWTYGDDEQGYFFGTSEMTAKVFGLIEIDLNTTAETEFNIHFGVRSSVWEYYIIDKQANGNDYEIVDEQANYQFKASESASVLGGKPAVKIVSDDLIPFKQYPDYEFKLVTKVNSESMKQPWNGSMILPAARSEHLQLSGAQESAYITPIYIYI